MIFSKRALVNGKISKATHIFRRKYENRKERDASRGCSRVIRTKMAT